MDDISEKIDKKSLLLKQFKKYDLFCRSLIDAYVLIDMNGKALKCNVMLGQMLNIKSKQILKIKTHWRIL